MTRFENLADRKKKILNEVSREIACAPGLDKARRMLEAKNDGSIVMANDDLQPIGFSLKYDDSATTFSGVVMESLAWLWFSSSALILTVFVFLFTSIGFQPVAYKLLSYYKVLVYKLRYGRWVAGRRRYNAYKRLRTDTKPPTLYLRSFSTSNIDELLAAKGGEETFAEYFERFGPVIAVAGPDDKGPLPGPVRLYFDNDIWQAAVTYLMSVSQRVVIHLGITHGTLVELGMARQMLEPEKLIIMNMTEDAKEYVEVILGCELTKNTISSQYIGFGKDWEPWISGPTGEWQPAKVAERMIKLQPLNDFRRWNEILYQAQEADIYYLYWKTRWKLAGSSKVSAEYAEVQKWSRKSWDLRPLFTGKMWELVKTEEVIRKYLAERPASESLLSQWRAIKSETIEEPFDGNRLRVGWDMDQVESWKVDSLNRLESLSTIKSEITSYLEKDISEDDGQFGSGSL